MGWHDWFVQSMPWRSQSFMTEIVEGSLSVAFQSPEVAAQSPEVAGQSPEVADQSDRQSVV